MKKLIYILTILAFGFTQAQPQKVNYQAVALTAGGQTVKNQAIKLRLSIVDSSATGTVLYTETHQPTTDGAGQFSVFLGGGTATLGTFSNIAWSNGKDKFLKAEADVTGGTNYVLMGTSQIVSVPYALAAGSLVDSSKVTAQDGTQWSLIVGPNGPSWQQISGPGGLNMNYPCPGMPTVSYGGQTYNTVQIGTQCWFKENLNVGTMVPSIIGDQTNNGLFEKYCYADDLNNCNIYGGIYQWAELVNYKNGASLYSDLTIPLNGNVQGICPIGWHIPSDAEWCILSQFLDPIVNCSLIYSWSGNNGGLKSSSNLWLQPNQGATNSSGFSAEPGGYRGHTGVFTPITFNRMGVFSGFWTCTELPTTTAIMRYFEYWGPSINRNNYPKWFGLSARCIKD
jgi:uncharacterized protein (TIGR02145 family)